MSDWHKISDALMRNMERQLLGLGPETSNASANYSQAEPLSLDKIQKLVSDLTAKPTMKAVWCFEDVIGYSKLNILMRRMGMPDNLGWFIFPVIFFDRRTATKKEWERAPDGLVRVPPGVYIEMSDGNHVRIEMK